MAFEPKDLPGKQKPHEGGIIPAAVFHPELSTDLTPDRHGNVNSTAVRNYLIQKFASSSLKGLALDDGPAYGIVTSTAVELANYMTGLSYHESGHNIYSRLDHSYGLFQISPQDAVNYHLNGGKPFTKAQLLDPKTNIDAAVAMQEQLIGKAHSIKAGAGRYWSPIGGQHNEHWVTGHGRDSDLPWAAWNAVLPPAPAVADATPRKQESFSYAHHRGHTGHHSFDRSTLHKVEAREVAERKYHHHRDANSHFRHVGALDTKPGF